MTYLIRAPDWSPTSNTTYYVFESLRHSQLTELGNDDHTQYLKLAGRSGGQSIYGNLAAVGNLRLYSTSHTTKGKIYFGAKDYYDENNKILTLSTAYAGERNLTLQFILEDQSPAYTPWSYFTDAGGYQTGSWVIISNKRYATGYIQGVAGITNEPGALEVAPDVNGPCLKLENYTSGAPGYENCGILDGYDRDDIWGGAGPYTVGFGKKKFSLNAKGKMYFGSNLQNTPIASATITFGPNTDYTHLVITAPPSGGVQIGTSIQLNDTGANNGMLKFLNWGVIDCDFFLIRNKAGNINNITSVSNLVGIGKTATAYKLEINGDISLDSGYAYRVNAVQVVGARVIDARCDDIINSGDATTDGVIDAIRDAMISHGLLAAA